MVRWIISCILLMPWLVVPIGGLTEQFRAPKAMFFDIMMMGIIVIALIKGIAFQYRNKYLAWFSGWVLFTVLFNWHINVVMGREGGFVFNAWTVEPTLHFIFILFATFLAISCLEKEHFLKIGKAICFSASLVSVVAISQWLYVNPFHGFLHYVADMHPGAFLDNPMILGNYICLSVPLFLFYNKRKYYIGLALVLAAIVISKSDTSMIAATVSILLYLLIYFRSRRLFLWFFLLLTIVTCMLSFHADGFVEWLNLPTRFSGRLEVWEQAVPLWKNNPWFGHGLGRWKTLGIMGRGVYWIEAHNDWLERTIELGLVGMFLFILVISNAIRNVNWNDRLACAYFASFIAFLIIMFGAFPMEIAPLGLTGLIGFWAIESIKKERT